VTMTYKQLVAEGRRLVKEEGNVRWQLGDLAEEVLQTYEGDNVLADYAAEIGCSLDALQQYRRTAVAWPKGRNRGSWSVYNELASSPDRVHLLDRLVAKGKVTVDEARRETGKRSARLGNTVNAPTPEKVTTARELLRDPDVRRELLGDRKVRAQLGQTVQEIADEKVKETPVQRRGNKLVDDMTLSILVGEAAQKGREFITLLAGNELTDEQRELLTEKINKTIETWSTALSVVEDPISKAAQKYLDEIGA
jgi:hypothetical protein